MAFNRLNHTILGEIRPRFKLKINYDSVKAMNHVSEKLKIDEFVTGERNNHHLFVKTKTKDQHYWSPEMSVRIEQEEYGIFTTVSCLIGPKHNVWTLFVFMYAMIFLASIFGGIYGLVKWVNFDDKSWLWVIPAGIICTASIFIVSKLGQKKGRDEMLYLVSFIYHSLDEITIIERIDD